MKSGVGNTYHQLKGVLNCGVDRLTNRVDEQLRTLEGEPPSIWHNTCRSALSQMATVGWLIQHNPRVDAWRWQGCNWSVVYAGSNYHMAELQHILHPQAQSPTLLGRVTTWDLQARTRQWGNDAELVVCELTRRQPWSSPVAYSFTMAPWVRMVLDVGGSLDSVMYGMRKSIRKKLRKTMKSGFVCRNSHNQSDFDLFYHSMFLPFISRFGERAITAPYDDMLTEFQRGGLIMLYRDGQPISGEMWLRTGNTLYGTWLGVLHGDYSLVCDGNVQFAMHWFAITLAQQMGCRYYDLGRALPSGQDGMLYFKLSWGAQLRRDYRLRETWTFFSTNLPAGLRQHLNEQQFLTEVDGKHHIVFLSDPQDSQESSLVAENLDMAQRYGLGGVLIVKRGSYETRPVKTGNRDEV